jgi:DNA (cytosine-5)-methyltransferase 1
MPKDNIPSPVFVPRLLDLFCGAGGAARGYQLAGFHVTGVDIKPQPRYAGDVFIEGDALEYCREHGHEYDAIHASPPCQGYSRMRHLPWLKGKDYPLLIDATRNALDASGVPWVIENVEDAPLRNGVVLCGAMFGLKVYRHRGFESSQMLLAPPHTKHTEVIGSGRMLNDRQAPNANGWVSHAGKGTLNRNYYADGVITVGGHNYKLAAGAAAMGIDWMKRDELSQAIPPAYTEHIGRQLMQAVR